jgi:plastocyanin
MIKRVFTLLCGTGGGALLLAALLLTLSAGASAGTAKTKPHGVPAPFGSIEFDITETMVQATNSTKDVPVPSVNPKTLSDAYDCTGCTPGSKAITVQQDLFIPAEIVVHQGDVVALRIFDVEGHHVITLYDPTGATLFSKFKTTAGTEHLKVFTANQLGYYRLDCETHDPTMRMEILVLRKGA